MAQALDVYPSGYMRWEAGSSFPSSPRVLMLLDKLYGDTIKVIFGMCKENGIQLAREEVREVMSRLSEFENTSMWEHGKSQPPGWAEYQARKRAGK